MSADQGRPIIGHRFNHVYEGGTHDVWCDGMHHLYVQGGKIRFPFHVKSIGHCDCELWKRENEKAASTN